VVMGIYIKFSLDLRMPVSIYIYRYGISFSLSGPRRSLMTLSCQATDLFLRATASMLSAHMLSPFRPSVRPSVCPSVCPSHGWISQNG